MTIAQLATIPERSIILERVIKSLIHQVDEIRLAMAVNVVNDDVALSIGQHLDARDHLPAYLIDPKIFISYHDNTLQDGAKFLNAPEGSGHTVIVCDDDIEYPYDFVERMRYALLICNGGIVSCMGKTLNPRPIQSYFKDELTCVKTFEVNGGYHIVEIPGTCAMIYNTSKIIITTADMKSPNADICVGVLAKQKGVQCHVRPHLADWLTDLTSSLPKNSTNMFDRYKNDDSILTEFINANL